jgi:hypothetical protein
VKSKQKKSKKAISRKLRKENKKSKSGDLEKDSACIESFFKLPPGGAAEIEIAHCCPTTGQRKGGKHE